MCPEEGISLPGVIRYLQSDPDGSRAKSWFRACALLFADSDQVVQGDVDSASASKKAQVLIHGFGRANGLFDAALNWHEPIIPGHADDELARLRGMLWRYVMAYSAWELVAKSVMWNAKSVHGSIHDAFNKLLPAEGALQPPYITRSAAPARLVQWLEEDARQERCLPTFLGLGKKLQTFPFWLVNESHRLNEQQVLAAMRHIVAHGALSPTKAKQWGLEILYGQAPQRLQLLTGNVLTLLTTMSRSH
jgi:hypothetical protein